MLPVLWKELRSRMRGLGTPAILTAYLGVLAAVALGVLVFMNRQGAFRAQNMGEGILLLFGVLSGVQLLLVAFVTPALTAGAIAGERERQTLDLLIATGLPGWGILAGKLLAAMAFAALLMAASIPVFMIIFSFGGVPYAMLVHVLVLQFVTALTLGCAGLLFSVLVRRSGAATALAVGMTVLVLFGTLGIGVLQEIRLQVRRQQAMVVQAVATTPAGVVLPPPPPQPVVVPDPGPPMASAFYVSPLAALVAAIAGPLNAPPFRPVHVGALRVPVWGLFSAIYLLLGLVLFGLCWAVLDRRTPSGLAFRRTTVKKGS